MLMGRECQNLSITYQRVKVSLDMVMSSLFIMAYEKARIPNLRGRFSSGFVYVGFGAK